MDASAQRTAIMHQAGLTEAQANAIPGETAQDVLDNWKIIDQFRPKATDTKSADQHGGEGLDLPRLRGLLDGLKGKFGEDAVKAALAEYTGLDKEVADLRDQFGAKALSDYRKELALKHNLSIELIEELPGSTPAELTKSLEFALKVKGQQPATPQVAPVNYPPARFAGAPSRQSGQKPEDVLNQFKQNLAAHSGEHS